MGDIVVNTVTYDVDGLSFEGLLLHVDGAQPQRGLLMAPNFLGISPLALDLAKQLVTEDSVILVLDPYGVQFRSGNPAEADIRAEMQNIKADNALLRRRLTGAYETLKTEAGKLGVAADKLAAFGFCFGGACVLELARAGIAMKAFISIHGLLQTPYPEQSKTPTGPVLVLNGADDPLVPQDIRLMFEQEMNRINADWQLVHFGHTLHAFTDPKANVPGKSKYNPTATRRAFVMMNNLLDEVMG